MFFIVKHLHTSETISINMFKLKVMPKDVPTETYIADEQAEAHRLALELLDRQYIVEVSEIESED